MGKLYAVGNTIMRGMLPVAHRREIMQWIEANRPLVVAEWNRCNPDIATA